MADGYRLTGDGFGVCEINNSVLHECIAETEKWTNEAELFAADHIKLPPFHFFFLKDIKYHL